MIIDNNRTKVNATKLDFDLPKGSFRKTITKDAVATNAPMRIKLSSPSLPNSVPRELRYPIRVEV